LVRAEPLFASKQKQQAILNQKLQQRNKMKDEKMALIYKIIDDLNQLKGIREDRLRKLGNVFGDDDALNGAGAIEQSRIAIYTDFIDSLENVAQIK
jgi:hypothetical protein